MRCCVNNALCCLVEGLCDVLKCPGFNREGNTDFWLEVIWFPQGLEAPQGEMYRARGSDVLEMIWSPQGLWAPQGKMHRACGLDVLEVIWSPQGLWAPQGKMHRA